MECRASRRAASSSPTRDSTDVKRPKRESPSKLGRESVSPDPEDSSPDSESHSSPPYPKDESQPFVKLGQGPHTFYLWADAILALFDEEVDEQPVLRCKSATNAAYEALYPVPESQREEARWQLIRGVRQWEIYVPEGARERSAAQAMARKWQRRAGTGDPATSSAESVSECESDEEVDNWWWEVTLQREVPSEGWPTLEVELHQLDDDKDVGTWWITNIRPAGEEGDTTMSVLLDCLLQELS